jgi:hypothetical protein
MHSTLNLSYRVCVVEGGWNMAIYRIYLGRNIYIFRTQPLNGGRKGKYTVIDGFGARASTIEIYNWAHISGRVQSRVHPPFYITNVEGEPRVKPAGLESWDVGSGNSTWSDIFTLENLSVWQIPVFRYALLMRHRGYIEIETLEKTVLVISKVYLRQQ